MRRKQPRDKSRLFVCDRACSTCIYGSNSPLSTPERLAAHEQQALANGGYAECHHASVRGLHTACRGFYNRHPNSLVFHLGRVLGRLFFLSPDAGRYPAAGQEDMDHPELVRTEDL